MVGWLDEMRNPSVESDYTDGDIPVQVTWGGHQVTKQVLTQIGISCIITLITLLMALLHYSRTMSILLIGGCFLVWLSRVFLPSNEAGNPYSWFLYAIGIWLCWIILGFLWGNGVVSPIDQVLGADVLTGSTVVISPFGSRSILSILLIELLLSISVVFLCSCFGDNLLLQYFVYVLTCFGMLILPTSEDLFLLNTGPGPVILSAIRPLFFFLLCIFNFYFRVEQCIRHSTRTEIVFSQKYAFIPQYRNIVLAAAYVFINSWIFIIPTMLTSVLLYVYSVRRKERQTLRSIEKGQVLRQRVCNCRYYEDKFPQRPILCSTPKNISKPTNQPTDTEVVLSVSDKMITDMEPEVSPPPVKKKKIRIGVSENKRKGPSEPVQPEPLPMQPLMPNAPPPPSFHEQPSMGFSPHHAAGYYNTQPYGQQPYYTGAVFYGTPMQQSHAALDSEHNMDPVYDENANPLRFHPKTETDMLYLGSEVRFPNEQMSHGSIAGHQNSTHVPIDEMDCGEGYGSLSGEEYYDEESDEESHHDADDNFDTLLE